MFELLSQIADIPRSPRPVVSTGTTNAELPKNVNDTGLYGFSGPTGEAFAFGSYHRAWQAMSMVIGVVCQPGHRDLTYELSRSGRLRRTETWRVASGVWLW